MTPDPQLLSAAIGKLAVAVRNEWIDKVVLTGEEARALHDAVAADGANIVTTDG